MISLINDTHRKVCDFKEEAKKANTEEYELLEEDSVDVEFNVPDNGDFEDKEDGDQEQREDNTEAEGNDEENCGEEEEKEKNNLKLLLTF